MADPILLDGNVIDEINRGNAQAANALVNMSRNGRTIYITQQAYNEIIVNALPRQATANRIVLEKFNINIAPGGAMATRVEVYTQNQTRTGTVLSLPDSLVAAQAKALNAEIWSFDGPFRTNAAVTNKLGVKVAPECQLSMAAVAGAPNPPAADYRVGHRLLGLPPVTISAGGAINRPPGAAGSPSGSSGAAGGGSTGGNTKAVVGVADNSLPFVGGPAPRGTAIVGGIQMAFQGVNFALNLINDYIQGQRVKEALAQIEPSVNNDRATNPNFGVLIIIYFTQWEPATPDSLIQPGPAFSHIETATGLSRDEATQKWQTAPALRSGLARTQKEITQEVWIPPIIPAGPSALKTPFPVHSIATFAPAGVATFQGVVWGGVTGFDDETLRTVKLDPGFSPSFVVLWPRKVLRWYNGGYQVTTDIPLLTQKSSDGTDLTTVDLDPYLWGSASAVPAFPADEATDKLFARVPKTHDNLNLLGVYPNFGKVRWIPPINVKVITVIKKK
ncbi:MAG: hypothetical protein ABI878_09565 [Acidobacteriota bacterium]